MRLKDKVAVVTGGGTGVGRAIALGFASEGADLVIAQRRLELAKQVATEIERLGRQALAMRVDIANNDDNARLVTETLNKFGKIDILVNNAALTGVSKPFLDITEGDLDQVFSVNLKGTFLLTQRVAQEMVKQNKGKIINISSGQSLVGLSNYTHYAASKGGINAFTRALAAELNRHGIHINTIAVGFLPHEELRKGVPEALWETLVGYMKAINPLGRTGRLEDVAGLAVFLASEESDFINAQCISVDGGDKLVRVVIPELSR